MTGKILFVKDDLYHVTYDDQLDYRIEIPNQLDVSYSELMRNQKQLEETLQESITILEVLEDEENLEVMLKLQKEQDTLLENTEWVEFSSEYTWEEIVSYLKENPELKQKKIICHASITMDFQRLKELQRELQDDMEYLYFAMEENQLPVSYRDFYHTLEKIESLAVQVKSFQFSPLEMAMYIYDIVRDHVYVKGNYPEEARDLSRVLLGDKMVCLGYARFMKAIVDRIDDPNLRCEISILWSEQREDGHARNVLYINDEKYQVQGVYYSEPTFGRKMSEEDQNWLTDYRFFLLPKFAMELIDQEPMQEEDMPYFSSHMVEELERALEECVSFENIKPYLKSFQFMAWVIDRKQLFSQPIWSLQYNIPLEILLPQLEYYQSLFWPDILSAETLLPVWFAVRRKQNDQNAEKYPFGLEELEEVAENSEWILFNGNYDEEEHPISAYLKDCGMDRQFAQVQFVKAIKKVCEKKKKR